MCCSIADNNVHCVHVAWNKVVRKIYRLPYQTHTTLLSPIIGKPHIKFTIFGNFLNFAYKKFHSTNSIVGSVARNTCCRQTSIFGANLFRVLSIYDVDIAMFRRMSKREVRALIKRITSVGVNDYRVGFIQELLSSINYYNPNDRDLLQQILAYLCCD
jgi:hypothetical protein